jgi:hypothetical protein
VTTLGTNGSILQGFVEEKVVNGTYQEVDNELKLKCEEVSSMSSLTC